MEHVDSLHLLARTDELDWFRHHRTDREGSTTTGITIELRQYDTIEIESVVEFLRSIHGILTRHGVYHKERLIGVDGLLQIRDLIHHLLIDSQTTCGIDDDNGIALLLGLTDSILGDFYHILIAFLRVDVNTNRSTNHLQLFDSCRTIDVAGYQQRLLMMTSLQHVGKLTTESGLTRTLQTRHQDDGRTAFQLQFCGLTTHQLRQFIMHDLHHQLARLHGCEHIHTHRLLLDRIGKVLGNLIVDVGIQQGTPYVFQRFSNVNLGDFSLTFQYLERTFKSLG